MTQNGVRTNVLALIVTLMTGSAFAQNIVVNPGFEYPMLPASPADNPPYWTSNSASGTTSDMWWVFQSIPGWYSDSGAGIEVQRGVIEDVGPNSGEQKVELDSSSMTERGALDGESTNSSMYQDLPTHRRHVYELKFWYFPRTETPGDNVIEVYWDGELVKTVDDSDPEAGWREIVVSGLEATSSWTELRFTAAGEENQFGGYLDDVFVDEIDKARLKVSDVEIDYVTEYAVYGSFCVTNKSNHDATWVMLGDVSIEIAVHIDGHHTEVDGECSIEPEATGDVLAPHETRCYQFMCSEFGIELHPEEKTHAKVCVDGAWNQLGEYHDRKWCDHGDKDGDEYVEEE